MSMLNDDPRMFFPMKPDAVRVVQRLGHALLSECHFTSDVEEAAGKTSCVTRYETALDELVRITLHQEAVFVGSRF